MTSRESVPSRPAPEPTAPIGESAAVEAAPSESPTEFWDVVVVGGGPAGACAAIAARRAHSSSRVLLVDRCDFPRDKTCGDGVAPQALDVLERLGVRGLLDDLPEVNELRLGFVGGPWAVGSAGGATHVVPRVEFDARLLNAARERGVQVRRHRVRSVEVLDGGGGVLLDGTIRARVVIGADGAHSVVRSALGLHAQRPGTTAIALRGYAPVTPDLADEAVIVFARGGLVPVSATPGPTETPAGPAGATADPASTPSSVAEAQGVPTGARDEAEHADRVAQRVAWPSYAWSFPIGDGRANVGYGELLPRHGSPGPTRQQLVAGLEALLPGVAAGGTDWRAHHLPLTPGRVRQPDGPVLLCGDALGVVNPLTGEGIHEALLTGAVAGSVAARACWSGRSQQAGRRHRRALSALLGRHWRHVDAAARLARWPVVVEGGIAVAGRDPRLFADLADLGLGRGTITPRLGWALLTGALRHALRRSA